MLQNGYPLVRILGASGYVCVYIYIYTYIFLIIFIYVIYSFLANPSVDHIAAIGRGVCFEGHGQPVSDQCRW